MIQKNLKIVSTKIRKSAEGQDCAMRAPGCNGNSETVCFRHYNGLAGGSGWGRKSDDLFGFYGCQNCEYWYALGDTDRAIKDSYFLGAMIRTQRILVNSEIIIIK